MAIGERPGFVAVDADRRHGRSRPSGNPRDALRYLAAGRRQGAARTTGIATRLSHHRFQLAKLEHDPEKWKPVFPRDKREAFARRSCSNKKITPGSGSTPVDQTLA